MRVYVPAVSVWCFCLWRVRVFVTVVCVCVCFEAAEDNQEELYEWQRSEREDEAKLDFQRRLRGRSKRQRFISDCYFEEY